MPKICHLLLPNHPPLTVLGVPPPALSSSLFALPQVWNLQRTTRRTSGNKLVLVPRNEYKMNISQSRKQMLLCVRLNQTKLKEILQNGSRFLSHSVACLSTLLIMSLAAQKLCTLVYSHLSILAFVLWTTAVLSRGSLSVPISWSISPVFSSNSFKVSTITSRSFHSF